jgi:hypothetical protein
MEYTSKTLIENYLSRDLSEDEEAWLMLAVPAIQLWIDRKLTSHFGKVDATTRRYPGGADYIDIDPCTNISSVQLLDTYGEYQYDYTGESEYIALPVNGPVKTEISRHGYGFPRGHANVAVTAQFSEYYDGVPEDIKMVTTRLAAAGLDTTHVDASGSAIGKEMIEGHTIEYAGNSMNWDSLAAADPFIASVIDGRKKIMI